MTLPLHVPPFINYNCQLCGWCCRQYDITFSRADHERLAAVDWGEIDPSLANGAWCAPLNDRSTPDKYRLRYNAEGSCVFLGPDNLCRMHARMGELGKALACSLYPFTFAETPTGIYVGCRFSCYAVARGLGDPLARRTVFIAEQMELCRKAGHVPVYGDEVVFDGAKRLPWADYLFLEEHLIRVFLRDDLPFTRRLFLAHKFVDILRQVAFERVRGPKFRELLDILSAGLMQEAEREPLPVGAGALWRVLFRQFCFLFQSRQSGAYREMELFGKAGARLRNFHRGIQFAFGLGAPKIPALSGKVKLRKIASMPAPTLGPAEELALSRFLAGKLYGKQHFGKLFYGYSLLQGLEFLILSAGAVMWYARAHALARGADVVGSDDIHEAIRYVDFCYGYSRAPALPIERVRVRLLSQNDLAIRLALAQYV